MSFLTPSIIQLQVTGGTTTEFNSLANPSTGGRLTLSDHSRSPLAVDYEMIERMQRMANGTMRRYIIAKKHRFSCEWEMLPTIRAQVADGNADARDMKEYYESFCYKPLGLTTYFSRNHEERSGLTYTSSYAVYWTGFSFEVVKRFKNFDYWNVTAEFTEI